MPAFRPVFIGGAGRSGTTFVADLLGTHPQLSPVYETEFVVAVAREMLSGRPIEDSAAVIRGLMRKWCEALPHRPHSKRAHERFLHGPHHILFDRDFALQATEVLIDAVADDVYLGLRNFVNSLFSRHAECDRKPFWINKTPTYVAALPLLKRIWPDLLFIHCVRDGRDVAASVLTRPWGPTTWSEAGSWWCNQIQLGLNFEGHNPEHLVMVRYEDMVAKPDQALWPVLERLKLGGASETVERYLRAGGLMAPGRIGNWRQESIVDIAEFEASAGPTLRTIGYDPVCE